MPKRKRPRPPQTIYLLFTGKGELFDFHLSRADAESDAWGPRLRNYTIREYRLVLRKDEQPRKRDDG